MEPIQSTAVDKEGVLDRNNQYLQTRIKNNCVQPSPYPLQRKRVLRKLKILLIRKTSLIIHLFFSSQIE